MKHIKFEENIKADVSYKRDKAPKKEYVQKAPETENDEYDIPETKKWYQEIPEEPTDVKPLSGEEVAALKREATAFLHGESLANETKMSKIGSSDQKWARSLLMKGAMADRVAAATVLIQDSPIHNLTTLQNMVAMVKPSKKKDSLTAIETLTELFIFDLLIPDGKLRPFEARPMSALEKMCSGNKDHRKKIMMIWMYEDKLKETYAEFIKCLNNFAHDTIEAHKEKAVSALAKLLMHNPEQEKVLLSSIVNKLGDPSQKVASKVIYQLCQVLYNHPNMKAVVLCEIEKMLFRPNISAKAQYYGVCFLNQFYLSKDDSKIAENLVRVYFSFFRACIKKGEVDSRLMGGILTGVRRCQPFLSETAAQALQTQAHPLHRLVHLAGYTVALQALALLQQMGPTDRYYCALYKKLSHPETLTTTLPAMLLGLVYRSVKADENAPRVLAFLKRLLQLAAMSDAGRAAATLLVVARLARRHRLPLGRDVEQIKEEPIIDVTESSTRVPETNGDTDDTSNRADADNSTNLNSKKSKKKKDKMNGESKLEEEKVEVKENVENLKKKLDWWIGDKLDLLNDGDDDEVYHDIPLEEDEQSHKKQLHNLVRKKKESSGAGWLHTTQSLVGQAPPRDADDDEDDEDNNREKGQEYNKKDMSKAKEFEILIKRSKNMEKVVKEYMPLNRNPAFCGAEHSVVTELLLLKNHYHPSVRLFSEKLLQGSVIQYNGDPLKDFSIARFLDRFAFKNPKKDPSQRPVDPDEPIPEAAPPKKLVRGSHPKFAVRKNYAASGIKTLPVNSNAYLNEDEAHIPVDEKFLYDYFQMRRQVKGDESDAESDTGSVDSVEFESYLDSISGKPKKGADESEEESQDEMDYMKEMVAHSKLDKKSKREAKGDEEEDDEDGESDEEGEASDGGDGSLPSDMDLDDADLGDDDDDADLDGDDSDLVFSGEDDEEEAMLEGRSKKGKKLTKKSKKDDSDLDFSEDERDMMQPPAKNKKKGGKKGVESIFASAEEFATLLEETGTSKKQGTSQAVSTTDNADVRQLNWEESRDHWVRGKGKFENRSQKKGGKFEKGGKKFERNGKKFDKSGKSKKVGQGDRKRKNFAGAGNSSKKRKSN